MEKLHTEEVRHLFEAILSLANVDECYKFFEDICTVKEILDISQRLKAAKMLKNGANYIDICKETGMSTATISRVSKCLEYGGGGYAMIIDRVSETKES
ncbi:MAG: TrpR YerC/YecD [Clostridia bacterium]|nr:TrpR YerC/YecD [Clostridia bacterium]